MLLAGEHLKDPELPDQYHQRALQVSEYAGHVYRAFLDADQRSVRYSGRTRGDHTDLRNRRKYRECASQQFQKTLHIHSENASTRILKEQSRLEIQHRQHCMETGCARVRLLRLPYWEVQFQRIHHALHGRMNKASSSSDELAFQVHQRTQRNLRELSEWVRGFSDRNGTAYEHSPT